MSGSFDHLVRDTQAFCKDLAQNNTREWYQANKSQYDSRLKAPATHLIETLRPQLAKLTGSEVTGKLFRINRDLRFAKGKPPYKDFLHMLWYSHQHTTPAIGWFFGIEKDRLRVGAGFMSFEGEAVLRWRAAITGPDGDDIADDIAGQLAGRASHRGDPDLKRVPSPYPKDHPNEDLLRRKSLTLWRDMQTPEQNLPAAVLREFETFWPCLRRIHAAMN